MPTVEANGQTLYYEEHGEGVPLDDARTYKLFSDGKTEAVFQFESRGMQGMLKDARPDRRSVRPWSPS